MKHFLDRTLALTAFLALVVTLISSMAVAQYQND